MSRFKSTIPLEMKLNFAGGGGGETTTTQQVEFPEELRPLFRAGANEALSIFRDPSKRQLFPGAFTAGPTTDITRGRENLLGTARTTLPQLAGAGSTALQDLFGAGDISRDPNLPGVVQGAIDPVIARLTNEALPAIRGGAIQAGQFGGARQGLAEGAAVAGTAREALTATSNILSDAYGRGLEAKGKGLALLPSVIQQQLVPGSIQQQIGGQLQGEEQAQINEARARFQAGTPQGALQNLIASLQGLNPQGGGGTSRTFLDDGGASQTQGAIGGGLLGYGAASSPYGAALGALLGYALS